jgi:hypothetical protein
MDAADAKQHGLGGGYAVWQLSAALVSAARHEDPATRRRAVQRVERWQRVLDAMANGQLEVGSRTPVRGLPAWVTPEVVRGGFATGQAMAAGDLEPQEARLAEEYGLLPDRRALFAWHLTDAGLIRLWGLLDDGRYQVTVPEEAALLTVAWLLQAGDLAAALDLLAVLEPWAGTLRFVPRSAPQESASWSQDWSVVARQTVGEVAECLGLRREQHQVATMREALTVWNPFADELLVHWLETAEEGRIGRRFPDGWFDRGAALLDRYERLAATYQRCSKHRNPKENLAILRLTLAVTVAERVVPAGRIGLAQHVVDAMIARRGRPGSAALTDLRNRQAQDATLPTHHTLAQLVLRRLTQLDQNAGLRSVEPVLDPVDDGEARTFDVPSGTALPGSVRQVVQRALAAPVEELMAGGHVPSAEVLAELVPQLAAITTAAGYRDDALRTLMARTYRAFRARRSLLLVNLQRQVGIDELPWVRAVAGHREDSAGIRGDAGRVLVRLGELALAGFPGTILPNPLIRELDALSGRAGLGVPFTEELAADIFMGAFSPKFVRAAGLAAELLAGSVYERYYGLDYATMGKLPDRPGRRGMPRRPQATWFDDLCVQRAGGQGSWGSVAANGRVIEQAQILTTHNLAALVVEVGVKPACGWEELAWGAFAKACQLVGRLHHNPRPLRTVKDAAYAWRQLMFFLSLMNDDQVRAFLARARQDTATARSAYTRGRVAVLLSGLERAVVGEVLEAGRRGEYGPFLGWTDQRHWILDIGAAAGRR